MPFQKLKGDNVDIYAWAPASEIEEQAMNQLRNMSSLPWVFHHVAAMPDVHFGKGATVGSVVAMKGAVAPAAVGVDIGCGMAAVKTSLTAKDLPDDLRRVRNSLEAAIPVGFKEHRDPTDLALASSLWQEFKDLDGGIQALSGKAMRQMGTLGGGNHFIELCLDTGGAGFAGDGLEPKAKAYGEQGVWLMLHSGSRGIGNKLAEIHMARARKLAHNQDLPDRDLAVFIAGTPQMAAYRHDLFWAQRYAFENRKVMLQLAQRALHKHFPQAKWADPIVCHHNYVAEEVHFGEELLVTRKGAIRAGRGELGIIPGSMGTRSYIVRGLGNPHAFESASHGAGRKMSRGQARKKFTVADLKAQTEGVECRKDEGVLDEIPAAYKPIEQVMAQQSDLVEVVAELRQVLCVKG